jgi:hypothetical protein
MLYLLKFKCIKRSKKSRPEEDSAQIIGKKYEAIRRDDVDFILFIPITRALPGPEISSAPQQATSSRGDEEKRI